MNYCADRTAAMPKQQDPSETIEEFKGCVNMDVKELQKWLKTKESNEVILVGLLRSKGKHLGLC